MKRNMSFASWRYLVHILALSRAFNFGLSTTRSGSTSWLMGVLSHHKNTQTNSFLANFNLWPTDKREIVQYNGSNTGMMQTDETEGREMAEKPSITPVPMKVGKDESFQWEDSVEESAASIAALERIRAMALRTAYSAEQRIRELRATPVVVEGQLVDVSAIERPSSSKNSSKEEG